MGLPPESKAADLTQARTKIEKYYQLVSPTDGLMVWVGKKKFCRLKSLGLMKARTPAMIAEWGESKDSPYHGLGVLLHVGVLPLSGLHHFSDIISG